ncbi:MAG: hypothetical protein JWO42_3842 [Chloroflexi bacterium]|nr:hypothetical protein [Chloroflexota bacterium]
MRALLVVLVVTLFALMCPPLPAALVTASGLGGAVTIAGVVPVAVREGLAMRDMMLPANTDLHFVLGLSSRNPAGFDAALRAVYDPHNPMYRHFLAAETITTRFGPDPAQVQALKQWLVSQGLHPQPWAGSMLLDVRGTAARVSTAFGIGMWRYRPAAQLALKSAVSVDAANRIVPSFAPDRDPRVPSQFSGLITSIVGLQGTIQPVAQAVAHAAPAARPRRGPAGGYDPAQIAGAYDFKPLYAAGYHAANTRVAIVEFAPYDPADIRAYDTWAGVNSTIHNIAVGDSTGSHTGSIEATLDIELLSSTAPGATIDVYNAPNDATGVGLLDAYSAVVSAGNAQVLGLTWVTCEAAALQIKGLVPDEHALFKQLALLGTTIVSATGDAGAYACSDSRGASTSLASQPTVNLPASDPYSLAVAATDLTVRTTSGVSAIGYETAWSCNATHSPACAHTGFKGLGSGGGVSTVFQTGDTYGDDMSWQIGPGVGNKFSGGARQVPDVAISGSSGISI